MYILPRWRTSPQRRHLLRTLRDTRSEEKRLDLANNHRLHVRVSISWQQTTRALTSHELTMWPHHTRILKYNRSLHGSKIWQKKKYSGFRPRLRSRVKHLDATRLSGSPILLMSMRSSRCSSSGLLTSSLYTAIKALVFDATSWSCRMNSSRPLTKAA